MTDIALISEGPSDQVVIENIVCGYFDDIDVSINPLQPLMDETAKSRFKSPGGWYQVFEYCKSDKFLQAFKFNDYVIIQIDTDVSEEIHYDIPKIENGIELTPSELINKVIDKFISIIGSEYENYKEKIIFAISVHSIECWLLPLYFESDKAKRSKTANCLNTLNDSLSKKHGFTIDQQSKGIKYYQKISKDYSKNKILMKMKDYNPSLSIFIDELNRKIKIN